MSEFTLRPTVDTLQQEYVLVQAWKKAHDYVRAHNWYADVLELDLSNTRLKATVDELRQELRRPAELRSMPVRLVLAPKGSKWEVGKDYWRPKLQEKRSLRPLAHMSIRDQTIATTFMLCMADHAETLQGDPTLSLEQCRATGMVSYGHRLLTDVKNGVLRYRWANAAYYRGYFKDYQSFIRRPDRVVGNDFPKASNWAVVHADFSQFYDRVRPNALQAQVAKHFAGDAEPQFLEAFQHFFDWRWHPEDENDAKDYAKRSEPTPIGGFERLALPQGLAASGFFANVFLIDFDRALWALRDRPQKSGWQVVDYCRYVDDLRLVIRLPARRKDDGDDIREEVTSWLQALAARYAAGMTLNPKKTSVLLGRSKSARTLMFSDAMKAIQQRASGAMDLDGGEETLTMIEGLFASEPEESPLAKDESPDADPFFAIFQDVKDETVARFSANRFRKTFRLVRPLAAEGDQPGSVQSPLTKNALDHRATQFARRLIWRWVKEPSNVRLLRVALDLNPDPEVAKRIISLLRPIILEDALRGWAKKVAEYCAAELFRAAATEIGMRADPAQLPSGANPLEVRRLFADLAQEVFALRPRPPWYLLQQALLLLASANRPVTTDARSNSPAEWRTYLTLHEFLRGRIRPSSGAEVVRFTLAAGCFDRQRDDSLKRFHTWLTASASHTEGDNAIRTLLEEDLDSAERAHLLLNPTLKNRWASLFAGFGIGGATRFQTALSGDAGQSKTFALAEVAASDLNPFRQEYLALSFLDQLLERESEFEGAITPWSTSIKAKWATLFPDSPQFLAPDFRVGSNIVPGDNASFYEVPDWLPQDEQWRYRVGQLLRSVVVGNLDYTASFKQGRSSENRGYRPYASHWYRRRYGLFNGRSALGPDWLPISSWFCDLLTRLLAWPGFPVVTNETGLEPGFTKDQVKRLVKGRIELLRREFGRASSTPVLRQSVRLRAFRGMGRQASAITAPLRVAVVQTVLPRSATIAGDPELLGAIPRFEQLRHFTSALAALSAMLRLRETHNPQDGRLDLLVLPELSIHPDDVRTTLVPFARQHRCIVFGGLIYHRLVGQPRQPLVNTGLWLLPTENTHGGLRMERIEQGKKHLAPNGEDGIGQLEGWRPCQHIIELVDDSVAGPLWRFSGSICYDATDLALASDLRNLTDTWLVPALNRDVNLLDAMVAALHYHMYQHVVVCNNGEFGGSVAQAPFSESFRRTILHHHGNEQAAISFFELELGFYRHPRPQQRHAPTAGRLKTRPAGITR